MRWEDERYVRIYTRNTADWIAMQWQGRAVFYELSRNVDRTGFVALGKSGMRGLAGMLLLPIDVVETGIQELLTDGCVIAVDGGLLIRNFIEAQETPQSDKSRKRAQRERDRDTKRESATTGRAVTQSDESGPPVTSRDDSSHIVTESHAQSHEVTPGHSVPCRAVPYSAETHTHRADAPAREDDPQGDALPMACAREDFAALLVTVDILAALAADAGLVTDLHSGFAMAHGGRATIALAQQAIAACMAREPLREMTPRQQRERLGSYLANQRRARDRESDRGLPSPSHPDVQHALAVFGEVWAAKKHETFVRGEGDEEHAAALVNLAKAHASKDLRGSAIVRHWAEEYLADAERFVADANHPLRLLPRRVGQYGVPKALKPKKAPEPEPTFAKPPPGTLAAFKGATS